MLKLRNKAKDIPEAFVYGSESNPLKLGMAEKDILPKYENLYINRAFEGGGSNLFDASARNANVGTSKINNLSRVNKFGQTTKFADINDLGSTNAFTGNIKIQKGLSGQKFKETLRHELVHRFLTPRSGPLKELRQKIRWQVYDKSNLFRFIEEAIAETYGTKSITKGLAFPIKAGYMTTNNLLKEGAIAGGILGILGGGTYIGYKFLNEKHKGGK